MIQDVIYIYKYIMNKPRQRPQNGRPRAQPLPFPSQRGLRAVARSFCPLGLLPELCQEGLQGLHDFGETGAGRRV